MRAGESSVAQHLHCPGSVLLHPMPQSTHCLFHTCLRPCVACRTLARLLPWSCAELPYILYLPQRMPVPLCVYLHLYVSSCTHAWLAGGWCLSRPRAGLHHCKRPRVHPLRQGTLVVRLRVQACKNSITKFENLLIAHVLASCPGMPLLARTSTVPPQMRRLTTMPAACMHEPCVLMVYAGSRAARG